MDEVDVEGALPLYTALLTRYRQQYKAQQAGASNAASSTGSGEKVWERYDEAGALAGLRGYLTAATAKDCGVMVTLQLLEAEPGSDPEAAAAAALAAHKGKAWPKLVQLEAGEGPGPSSRPVWALYKVGLQWVCGRAQRASGPLSRILSLLVARRQSHPHHIASQLTPLTPLARLSALPTAGGHP